MQRWLKKKEASTIEPDRSTIVPRIKVSEFVNALQRMNTPLDQMPVTEPLVGDLLITYSFDLPGLFQMVSRADLAHLGVSLDEVRDISVNNLKRQLPNIGVELFENQSVKRIVTGSNLEACALLATSFWNNEAAELKRPLVAVVPSRDAIFFCEESADEIHALKKCASTVLQVESTHALSGQLLTWRNNRWELYGDTATSVPTSASGVADDPERNRTAASRIRVKEAEKKGILAREFSLGISTAITSDNPIKSEIRHINEALINWLKSRGDKCRNLILAYEADPSDHAEIVDFTTKLVNQDFQYAHLMRRLNITVALLDLKGNLCKELQMGSR